MERKSKKSQPMVVNATAIAGRAGCSRQLVSRLLQRGFNEEQIVSRIKENKAKEAARAAVSNGHTDDHVTDPHVLQFPSFAQSEARKEFLLAELRNLQLMREQGALVPADYIRRWGATFLTEAKDVLQRGPSELADPLAATADPQQCETIVQRWVERSLERLFQLDRLWGAEPVKKSKVV